MIIYCVVALIIACIGGFMHGHRDSLWDDTGVELILGAIIWPIAIPILLCIWLGKTLHKDKRYD